MRNATKCRSSYLVSSKGVFAGGLTFETQHLMKKFLFLGAFAFFALTVSAQSTEAPADKKAKTEQTCAKDANKPACSTDQKASCDKSKSAGSCCSKSAGASASTDGKSSSCSKDKAAAGSCCSKGASASTDAKGASCSKSASSGCCSKGAAANTDDNKKSKKRGNKTSGLSGSN